MSRLIKCSIDVTKIKKEHIFEGAKGKYINVDVWLNDKKDDYGNDVGVKQSYKVGDDFDSHFIGNGKKAFGFDVKKPDDLPVSDTLPTKHDGNVGSDESQLPF